jgi:hypothetical protein
MPSVSQSEPRHRSTSRRTFAEGAELKRIAQRQAGKVWATLSGLLLVFVLIQLFLPLRTAVKIGADEDYELSKATLSLKSYKFYTEIWNDQPLLHTRIVTGILKNVSPSVLAARLVTSVFTAVLLASLFFIALRVSGLAVAALSTGLLIASPGFVELSASCMVEIPALAAAVAALAVLAGGAQTKWRVLVAGLLFAVSFQIKFINVILLPIAALILWIGNRDAALQLKTWIKASLLFAISLVIAFIGIGVIIDEGSFWLQMKQSWEAHFASAKSLEYGSPADRPFQWSIYLKNWDTTLPALVGLVISARQLRKHSLAIVPAAWFALELAVFGMHKPWWPYYYIHNAVPLCWCAAIGIAAVTERMKRQRRWGFVVLCALFLAGAAVWSVSRVYLQVADIRRSPKLYSSLVLKEIDRFKPFTKFIYTDEPVYSFHADIPLPPKLAVVSLKRFWSGDMTSARLVEELRMAQPGLVLLGNDTRDLPFGDWLAREYRMVYQDNKHRLYAHVTIVDKAEY